MRLRIFVFSLSVLLMAACSVGDGDETEAIAMSDYSSAGQVAVYEADWVIDRQVVDHTQLTLRDMSMTFGHWPDSYLLGGTPLTVAGGRGGTIQLSSVGKSALNNYYEVSSGVAPYMLTDSEGNDYQVQLQCEAGGPTAVYEQQADRWTVTWHVTAMVLTNMVTRQKTQYTFNPVLTMMLMTNQRVN